MRKATHWMGLSLLTLTLLACDDPQAAKPAGTTKPAATGASSAKPKTTATSTATATATATATSTASAAADAGGELSKDGYPLGPIRTIAEDCKTAFMVFSSAKKDAFEASYWPMADQAIHEHPQFKVVTGMPAKAMDIRFERYEMTDKPDLYLMAARCFDGATCNRLAAMYKGVVRASNPQLVCAEQIPSTKGAGTVMILSPKKLDDTRTKCARIAVCSHKLDRTLEKDLNLECQKAPHHFKLECHTKDTCEQVVECNKGAKAKPQ